MHSLLRESFESFNTRNYQSDKEITFHMLFNNLEEFLTKLKDKKMHSDMKSMQLEIELEEDDMVMRKKATDDFMSSARENIMLIKNQLESDGIYHYLPLSQLNKIISDTKQGLEKNYEKLQESLNNKQKSSESGSTNSKNDKDYDESVNSMQRKGKKGKNKIPKRALLVLKNWLTENFKDPYPNAQEKLRLARESGITLRQVQNWFTNARGRVWRKTCNPEKFSTLIEKKLKNESKL